MTDFGRPLTSASGRRRRQKRYKDKDGFGRFAEATARFMGSPSFILYMTIFVVAWIVANVALLALTPKLAWDPYPFILLNLAFSTQASYSAPLIILAQNRQDDRDRVIAEQDRQRSERSLQDAEYLIRQVATLRTNIGEMATRSFIRAEIRDAVEQLDADSKERIREREKRIEELQAELEAVRGEVTAFQESNSGLSTEQNAVDKQVQ